MPDEAVKAVQLGWELVMLTSEKGRGRILTRGNGILSRIRRWWMTMSDQEQREIMMRGVSVAACAAAVSVVMPTISVTYDIKQDEAALRDQTRMFAETEDAGRTVREAEHAPALLQHPWLVNVEYSLKRDPSSALSKYVMRDRDGVALSSITSFENRHFDKAESVADEFKCMAQAVYYEAGNQSDSGKLAVAEVITNRVRDHRYPNTVCGVVFQGATRTTGCQFTFTCDGAMDRAPKGKRWTRSQEVAAHVLMNVHEPRTGAATHYHANYVDPIWNSGLIKTETIGAHIFYRFPRGAEWARAQNALEARQAARRARPVLTSAAATGTYEERQGLSAIAPAPAP